MGKITRVPISADGKLLTPLKAPSPDGLHLFEMEKDTITTSKDGEIVTTIEIREGETPSLPEDRTLIGKAYNFSPSGITFSKPTRLTLGYDINQVPPNTASVVLAYYGAEMGWVELEPEIGAVAEVGRVTAPVKHFTIFAVLGRITPSASFTLRNLSVTPSVRKALENITFVIWTGREATVSFDIANQGKAPGTYPALLKMDGTAVDSKEIKLSPGETDQAVFTITGIKRGRHIIEIGSLKTEFQSTLWINWWLIVAIILVASLLGYLAYRYLFKTAKSNNHQV